MASNYGELIRKATELLDKFEADRQSVEEFTEEAGKIIEEVDLSKKKLILDIISGCIEHKKLLDIVINVFYIQHGKCLFKTDRNQFAIVGYLAMFLLDEIGLQCLSNIVKSLDIRKMHKFLAFFFNITNLTTWIQGEWSRIYDATYVERNWIAPLLRWRPEIEALMGELASRISRGDRVKKVTTKATEPQEYSLTKPKARHVPIPEPIPLQEKHHPVPSSTYRAPKEKHVMDEVKQRNRQKAEEMLYEANTQQFKCANPQKSDHARAVISQIKMTSESQLKFDSIYTSGTPATHKTNTLPIRLNTTAILREGALYNRQVEEELLRLERLVEGSHDPSSFLKWQKEMRERDLQEELAQVERRRLEGRISHEEATLARTRIMERNQKTAQLKKEETAELMQRYANKRLQEEKEMKDLVQQVAEGHKNSKVAKMKLQDFKQRIVKEVSEQSRELLRQALEEAQAEMSRKFELIRQIKAIESVPFIRHKFVDETETAGHHLLGEMSLAELRERLALLKDAEQREKEERRGRILEDKQEKEQLLLEQLDAIAIHRTALGQAALRRQEQKKTRQELQQAVVEDEKVLALQKKLEERRQDRQRLKQSERNKANSNGRAAEQALKSWNSRKKTLEEQHWRDLEKSLEHQVQKEASQRKAVNT
ncbi:cilia- and flagella-associated protein 99 [Aplochiton taeniatus]